MTDYWDSLVQEARFSQVSTGRNLAEELMPANNISGWTDSQNSLLSSFDWHSSFPFASLGVPCGFSDGQQNRNSSDIKESAAATRLGDTESSGEPLRKRRKVQNESFFDTQTNPTRHESVEPLYDSNPQTRKLLGEEWEDDEIRQIDEEEDTEEERGDGGNHLCIFLNGGEHETNAATGCGLCYNCTHYPTLNGNNAKNGEVDSNAAVPATVSTKTTNQPNESEKEPRQPMEWEQVSSDYSVDNKSAKHPKVGARHQACVVSELSEEGKKALKLVDKAENKCGQLLWDPYKLPTQAVKDYLHKAQELFEAQISEDKALRTLAESNYEPQLALQSVVVSGIDLTPTPMHQWTPSKMAEFNSLFNVYRKDFGAIFKNQRTLPFMSLGEILHYLSLIHISEPTRPY
eukprot:TRINITY_DN394_c0_g1_i2.p1 TRINITY_DN394_c0_g1~~TRINITY_DN394_c0_g1_i2.p1  ORF type:complete len:403 (+),score=64.30 TRINITY_DN394_c0_g1_i2:134-1342(+)